MKFGRDNISATIHVPFACKQNCSFCNIKQLYSKYKPNPLRVLELAAKYINKLSIPEVVISGGEPFDDVVYLHSLLYALPDKKVFINTCMPDVGMETMRDLVTMHKNLKGINISRHAASFDDELLDNIADDTFIEELATIIPVRINCVIQGDDYTEHVERWREFFVSLNLRQDYTITTPKRLHTLAGVPKNLLGYEFVGESSCEVCHTFRFNSDGLDVSFHKGLKNTKIGDTINDIIVYPNGEIALDWDAEPIKADEMEKLMNVGNKDIPTHLLPYVEPRKAQEEPRMVSCGSRCGLPVMRPVAAPRSCGGCYGGSHC